MAVQPIPDGYPRVTPMLIADGGAKLIDFICQAFGAQERLRMPMPDGGIGHAELTIGESLIMCSDPAPDYPPNQNAIHLYVEDVDAVYAKALAAGATSMTAPETMFYGDRSARLRDAFGNVWYIATHVEDVSDEEMAKRMEAMSP